MRRARVMLLAVLLVAYSTAMGQNSVVPSDTTILVWATDQGYFYNDTQYALQLANDQQYNSKQSTYIALSPALTPADSLPVFATELGKAHGIIFLSTDGNNGEGIMVQAYPRTPDGQNAAIWAAQRYTTYDGYDPSEVKIYPYGNGYGIFLTSSGIASRFHPGMSVGPIVIANACKTGVSVIQAFTSSGAAVAIGYPGYLSSGNEYTAGTALYNAKQICTRLNGQSGISYRTCSQAISGLTDNDPISHQNLPLNISGSGAVVTSPYVTYCSAGNGTLNLGSGTSSVSLTFSTNIETNPPADLPWFVINPQGGDAQIDKNSISISGNTLYFTARGVRVGNFTIHIAPRSSDALHNLDGNSIPGNTNGQGPNGDYYVINGYSSYRDNSWASAFSRAGAFLDVDGTHVYCVTSYESDVDSLSVFAGSNHDRLLTTVPAEGSTESPHFYEWVFPLIQESVFEVVEVDGSELTNYVTRPFILASIPDDIDSLRAINNQMASVQRLPVFTLGMDCQKYGVCVETPPPAPQPVDVIFASLRSDFLHQYNVELVKDIYRNKGWVVKDTLLATHNPAVLKNYYWSVWIADSLAGHPRPRLYLVGSANRDSTQEYCPTWWFNDPTGEMYPNPAPFEAFYTAFGSDSMPQLPHPMRIIGTTVSEIQFHAQGGWDALTFHANDIPATVLLNGNVADCGVVTTEPTATLEKHLAEFPGTVTMLSDSTYVCDDYAGRLTDLSRLFTDYFGPKTIQVIGTGNISGQTNWMFWAQQWTAPYFDMSTFRAQGMPARFSAVLPGCSLGDFDEYASSGFVGKLMLCSDPYTYSTAVAIIGPSRPNNQTYHTRMLDLYLTYRNSGQYAYVQDAYMAAALALVKEQPGAKWYVWSTVMAGWLTSYPDMLPTAVEAPGTSYTVSLAAASPNPTSGPTSIAYTLDAERNVHLAVYDVTGRQIHVLADGIQSAGSHAAVWNAQDARERSVGNGVYFLRLDAGGKHINRKLIVIR